MTIHVENVGKSFKGHQVLKDVSFSVEKESSFVLMGQSGSGKSVLLRTMLGFLPPDRGACFIHHHNVHEETEQAQCLRFLNTGVVFQSYALFDSMTVWENIAFLIKGSENLRREIAIESLHAVELPPSTAFLRPAELSGGMKRRVSIARAIALKPAYLFFDEPTEGLDPLLNKTISMLIRKVITSLKATAFTITHNLSSALCIGDTLAVLEEGILGWQGTGRAFLTSDYPLIQQFIQSSRWDMLHS